MQYGEFNGMKDEKLLLEIVRIGLVSSHGSVYKRKKLAVKFENLDHTFQIKFDHKTNRIQHQRKRMYCLETI